MTASTEPRGAERLVSLAEATSDELMALSISAKWNQTPADWAFMLSRGRGWGLRDAAGTLVASTLVLPYDEAIESAAQVSRAPSVPASSRPGPFAWISMVLVLPPARGRGLATRLLQVALGDLHARRLAAVLDATPAGRPVYAKLGFVDGWGFARWRRAGPATPPAAPRAATRVRPLGAQDWPAIAALDAPAFGAARLPLLRALAARLPGAAWVVDPGAGAGPEAAGLAGYVLGRQGRTASQIGPLVAADGAAALALLQAAVHALADAPLVVDLRDGWPGVQAWLAANGFAPERPFTRMTRGLFSPPGSPRGVVLVAGPELG